MGELTFGAIVFFKDVSDSETTGIKFIPLFNCHFPTLESVSELIIRGINEFSPIGNVSEDATFSAFWLGANKCLDHSYSVTEADLGKLMIFIHDDLIDHTGEMFRRIADVVTNNPECLSWFGEEQIRDALEIGRRGRC